ncbi:MAG: stage IV sporulation protein A [Eubacteriaceae bacterium]|jgi:stage IV sporulation protein A|nr:stage IV sporulation protein A [Eubacteriaceae bacterium]
MEQYNVYNDIKARTNGEIYVGIVGPVRTGKSTFIKKFMELLAIPNIDNRFKRERAIDELPQSGSGRTIMTAEPKFVPNEAVKIRMRDNTDISLRLIDCVGYLVPGALGAEEEGNARMVQTPWSDSAMPFEKAAEIGTKKVIAEHSTIGVIVTTDGSFTDIPREDYIEAEERVVTELKRINKPFVIVLNSSEPNSESCRALASSLEESYLIPVIALDVANLGLTDIENILTTVLYEFPVREIRYKIPKWAANLPTGHWLMVDIEDFIESSSNAASRIRSVRESLTRNASDAFEPSIEGINLSNGQITAEIAIDNAVFYRIMSDENDIMLRNESDLFTLLTELLSAKTKYDRFSSALSSANSSGYGIVYPTFDDMELTAPEMISEAGKYGIKIKASAPALHILSTEIFSEIAPIIGSESECETFYNRILTQYEGSQTDLWDTEIFGRKLSEMLTDNINLKLSTINEETKGKVMKIIDRISNNKKGGLFIFWL